MCETNDPYHFKEKIDDKHLNLLEMKKKIEKKQDIIGRKDNFKKNQIDESYPEYILKNLPNLNKWIA